MDKTKFMTTEYTKIRNKIKNANSNKNLICEEFCYNIASSQNNTNDLMVRLNKLRQIDDLILQFKAAH